MHVQTGTILSIGESEKINENMTKRKFVIKTEGQYPQTLEFECINKATESLNFRKVGERVEVKFDIKGREWNGKYFVNLQAFAINKENTQNQAPTTPSVEEPYAPIGSNTPGDEDDLPF
jgi:hypothetical protein